MEWYEIKMEDYSENCWRNIRNYRFVIVQLDHDNSIKIILFWMCIPAVIGVWVRSWLWAVVVEPRFILLHPKSIVYFWILLLFWVRGWWLLRIFVPIITVYNPPRTRFASYSFYLIFIVFIGLGLITWRTNTSLTHFIK